MKYGSDPKGKGKFTKYDDPKKREATKSDIMQYEATQKERMREGSRSASGAPKKGKVKELIDPWYGDRPPGASKGDDPSKLLASFKKTALKKRLRSKGVK